MELVARRVHSPPFSRSIPTVLRPDQKQKEAAPVLCVLKIKELLAQFLNRGGCATNKKTPFLSGADGVVSNFKQNKDRYAGIIRRLRDLLLTTIHASPYRDRASRPSAPLRNGIFLFEAQPPLSRNCASNSFIFSRHKTGAVSFCFWSGTQDSWDTP
jgi:hypothetical protein